LLSPYFFFDPFKRNRLLFYLSLLPPSIEAFGRTQSLSVTAAIGASRRSCRVGRLSVFPEVFLISAPFPILFLSFLSLRILSFLMYIEGSQRDFSTTYSSLPFNTHSPALVLMARVSDTNRGPPSPPICSVFSCRPPGPRRVSVSMYRSQHLPQCLLGSSQP